MRFGVSTKFGTALPLLIGLTFFGVVAQTNAQSRYYQDDGYQEEAFISIYEHCDFRGARRDIAVGDFANMRELDFDNDSMSSIQVPRELEAVIYEHDKFKGDYAVVNRDVRCFDQQWNDQVSSLRVVEKQRTRAYQDQNRSPVFGGRNQRENYPQRDGVNGLNVKQVVFDGRVLQKVGNKVWQINDNYNGVARYTEIRRDRQSVELKNQNTDQRIVLNMGANQALVTWGRGNQQVFDISSRLAGVVARESAPAKPDTRIRSRCFNYKVYTDGGAGSLRFSNSKDLFRFDARGYQGRACHSGELIVGFGKRDFNTDLTMEVDGRKFKFAAGEKETEYRANWYRKTLKLQVGR